MSRRHTARLFLPAGLALLVTLISTVAAQHGSSGDLAAQLVSLANPIVNAPDTNEHDTQSTTAIVAVIGTPIIVVAFNNSAVHTASNNHLTGWARSTDDGTTWTDGGALPDSANGDGGSPVLARDSVSGEIYLTTKAFSGSAVQLFRSTDNGATWLPPVNAAPGFGGGDVLDTPWIAIDNSPGIGQGNVYVIARNIAGGGGGSQAAGSYVSRSTDGGATFGPSPGVFMTAPWIGPSLAVGLDHAVYAFAWANLTPRQIGMRKSTDLGVTFGNFIRAATLNGTGVDGDLGLGGGFATNSNPQMIVDPDTDDLFLFFNDKTGADKADIYVTGSQDGGALWDGAGLVNNDGPYLGNHDQFMPTATNTPDGRHILVTWYDRRSDGANSLIERWGLIATKVSFGCCSTSSNFRISTGSWPVVIGQDTYVPANYMGSYDQVAASSAFFWVPWGDNRLPNPANTPLPHANQPDVRVARIPVSGPPRGEFDRDFQTDYTVFRPATSSATSKGVWYSALSSGGASITRWGAAGDIDVPGDYDGDAKTDIAVFRPSSGRWFIVQSSNGAVRVESWGQNGDIPMAADVDGDGTDDLAIFRPSAGPSAWKWIVNLSCCIGTFGDGWGLAGDIPLVGDFDGDGVDDVVAYRPSTGVWYILSPIDRATAAVGWGVAGDIPVVGDFDGDGKADPTIFRPSTGQWFVKKSTGGTMVATWGQNGDIPVSGDFDGDGKTDITIWRDSNGVWFSQLSSGGIAVVGWGITGDKPSGRVPGS